ncbi:hypothetical protein ACJO2E_08760 [Marinobacter sp. M1N3S26]|uniref:hypothetical protein n=1 Tax=Marinobacter sp. M1N3S26 TaxID=3382299 RepID=UPI00387B5FB7
MTEYTQGVTHDGAVILKDGVAMNIEQILEELQQRDVMKAPPTTRIEAIVDLIFEWIGPEGCDQQQVAERLQFILDNRPHGMAKLGRLLHACEEIRDDLLMRADIDSDGTRAVNVSHSKWERFNEAMDVARSALLDDGPGPKPAGHTNSPKHLDGEKTHEL